MEADTAPSSLIEQFLKAVEQRAGAMLARVDLAARESAPVADFVLLDCSIRPERFLERYSAEHRSRLASRLVPVVSNLTHTEALELLEKLSLAAMVDVGSLEIWYARARFWFGALGPYGRRDIAPLVDAVCREAQSANYCYMFGHLYEGLPHLLVEYLRVLDAELDEAT